MFRPYLDALADSAQIVYFDLPGHGRSPDPPDYSFAGMVQAIDSVRASLERQRVSLLGSSYGGFLALHYALTHPRNLEQLILVDTAPSYGFREASLQAAKERATPAMLAALQRLWDDSLVDDEDFRAAWRELLPLYFHALDHTAVRSLADAGKYRLATRRRILPEFASYDLRDRLHEIVAPTLIVAGRHDWITAIEQAQTLHDGIRHSELAIFENSGHYPFIEEPARFSQVVRSFLQRTVRA